MQPTNASEQPVFRRPWEPPRIIEVMPLTRLTLSTTGAPIPGGSTIIP